MAGDVKIPKLGQLHGDVDEFHGKSFELNGGLSVMFDYWRALSGTVISR